MQLKSAYDAILDYQKRRKKRDANPKTLVWLGLEIFLLLRSPVNHELFRALCWLFAVVAVEMKVTFDRGSQRFGTAFIRSA